MSGKIGYSGSWAAMAGIMAAMWLSGMMFGIFICTLP